MNGRKVVEAKLAPGDRIAAGDLEIEYQVGSLEAGDDGEVKVAVARSRSTRTA